MTNFAEFKSRQHKFVAGGLLLVCGLLSGNANAQVAVTDPAHTIETIFGWAGQWGQKGQEYYRQGQQLQTEIKQVEQMYVKGDIFKGKPGYREKLQMRPLSQGMSERCGDEPARHSMGAEQLAKCQAIVEMENRRYNATVKMLEDVAKRDEELQAALTERKSIGQEEKGKLESNTNRILAIQTQQENDVQNASNLLSAYDASLKSLREDSDQIARAALKGDGSLLDEAVQGAALHLALKGARERDR